MNAVSIKVDKVGNTFIGLIDLEEIRLFIYNVDAQLVDDLNFGKIGKEFCLVGVAYSDVNAQDTRLVVISVLRYPSI